MWSDKDLQAFNPAFHARAVPKCGRHEALILPVCTLNCKHDIWKLLDQVVLALMQTWSMPFLDWVLGDRATCWTMVPAYMVHA